MNNVRSAQSHQARLVSCPLVDKLTGDQNQTWQTGEGIEVRMTGISYLCEPSSSAWKNRRLRQLLRAIPRRCKEVAILDW